MERILINTAELRETVRPSSVSGSLFEHALRGLLGFGLLFTGLFYAADLRWWALPLLAGALISFRGCPTCWAAGLVETLSPRKVCNNCSADSCDSDRR